MSSIVALDVGMTRIGVAAANTIARLPHPHSTIINDATAIESIRAILEAESVEVVVVGLPRSLSGNETEQTSYTREFAKQLEEFSKVVFQDEALTSKKALAELESRGKPYAKTDVDALAATYILEDYLYEHRS